MINYEGLLGGIIVLTALISAVLGIRYFRISGDPTPIVLLPAILYIFVLYVITVYVEFTQPWLAEWRIYYRTGQFLMSFAILVVFITRLLATRKDD